MKVRTRLQVRNKHWNNAAFSDLVADTDPNDEVSTARGSLYLKSFKEVLELEIIEYLDLKKRQ